MHEMIIQVGPNRRILGYDYGWKLEVRRIKQKGDDVGAEIWYEDRPAYPATLAQAFQMCLERHFREQGDADISEVPERLRRALKALLEADEAARVIGQDLQNDLKEAQDENHE